VTYPTLGNPAIPYPFLFGSQWHHGEPINDVKLHQRIDEPLERLGLVARTHGAGWASFRGSRTGSTTGGTLGTSPIPFTVVEDTHNGWSTLQNCYNVPVNGRYLISASFAQSTVVSGQSMWLCAGTDSGGGRINDGMFPILSPVAEPIAGGGCQISTVANLFTFYSICVQLTATMTALSADSCWLSVQQIGWFG
jgi:hypothetical protein